MIPTKVSIEAEKLQSEANLRDSVELQTSVGRKRLPYDIQTIYLDAIIPKSKPLAVGSPFRSFIVVASSSSSAEAKLVLHSREKPNIDNGLPLKENSDMELPSLVDEAFILNEREQSGQWLQIAFVREGRYRSGKLVSVTSGGLALSFGDSLETKPTATIGTAVAPLMAAENGRKAMIVHNLGPGTLYLGDASVTDSSGSKVGVPVAPGTREFWYGPMEVFAIATAANTKVSLTKLS